MSQNIRPSVVLNGLQAANRSLADTRTSAISSLRSAIDAFASNNNLQCKAFDSFKAHMQTEYGAVLNALSQALQEIEDENTSHIRIINDNISQYSMLDMGQIESDITRVRLMIQRLEAASENFSGKLALLRDRLAHLVKKQTDFTNYLTQSARLYTGTDSALEQVNRALLALENLQFCASTGTVTLPSAEDIDFLVMLQQMHVEVVLSREEEIERTLKLLKWLRDIAKEEGNWTVRILTDKELLEIATDYVDVMRAVSAARNAHGFTCITDLDPKIKQALERLAGSTMGNIRDTALAINQAQVGSGLHWPFLTEGTIINLVLDRTIPNSTLKNILVAGGALAALFVPLWGAASVGTLTIGGATAPMLDYLKKIIKQAQITGEWKHVNEAMSQLSRRFQEYITGKKGMAFVQNGVRFDGVLNGRLVEVKGRYSQFVNSAGQFHDWFARNGGRSLIKQAENQLRAANGVPLDWYFLDAASMNAVKVLFDRAGVEGINFILSPFA